MAEREHSGKFVVYEVIDPGKPGEIGGEGETLRRTGHVLDARTSDEAAKQWREHLDGFWRETPQEGEEPASMDFRCFPLNSVEPVYFAEQETRVRGGTR